VDMASTVLVTGVLTTTAATVFNGGFASNAASTLTVTEDNHVNGLKLINSQPGGYGSALTFQSERSDNNAIVSAAQIRTQGQDSWNSEASADSNLFFATSLNGSLTDKMVIKHDGSVGIGTSSPAAKLDIRPANEAQNTFRIYRGIDSGYQLDYLNISQYAGDSVLNSVGSGNAEFIFQQNGTEAMRIDSSGNVGIGASSPAALLHVAKSADGGVAEIILENSFTNAGSSTDEYTQIQGRFGGYDASYILTGKEGDFTTAELRKSYLAFSTRTATTGITEKVRIDSSGNVGIGGAPSSTIRNDNSSAEKALQIGTRAMFFADGGVTTDLQNNSHLNNADTRVAMATDLGSLYQQYQGIHKWYNAASVSAGAAQTMTERMRIDSSGNLLVGKTALDNSTAGTRINSDGSASFVKNGNLLYLNRNTTDGDIVTFAKDNTAVGSIG
jgi:hypothetical protein